MFTPVLMYAWRSAVAAHAVVRLGDGADLDHTTAIDRSDDLADVLVFRARVAADVNLRLRDLHGFPLDPLHERVHVRHVLLAPVDFAIGRDGYGDVFRLGLR